MNRIFPVITNGLYPREKKEGQAYPITDLVLWPEGNLPKWKLITGLHLQLEDKVRCVLYFHKMALWAELEMSFIKADFFWMKAYKTFSGLYSNDDLWHILERKYNLNISLKDRLIEELFVSTHLAFCNGYLEKGLPDLVQRAFQHLSYINQVTDLWFTSPLVRQFQTQLIDLAVFDLEMGKKFNRVKFAAEAGIRTGRKVGCYYLERESANLIYEDLFEKLSEGNQVENQILLEEGVQVFESLVANYQCDTQIYDQLGLMNCSLAISLSNSEKPAEALLALRKAFAYNPSLEGLEKNWKQLVENMKEWQAAAHELQQNVAQNPDYILNDRGRYIIAEAKKGFGLVNQFMEKEEEIVHKRTNAYLYTLVRDIGILDELGEDWQSYSSKVNMLVKELLDRSSGDPIAWNELWENIIIQYRGISPNHYSKILDFTKDLKQGVWRQLGGVSAPITDIKALTEVKITPKGIAGTKNEEPFVYWLLSSKDSYTKVVAAAAIIMLMLCIALSIHKGYTDSKRNTAYQELNELLQQNAPYQVTLDKAEDFLSNLPVLGQDNRVSEVQDIYLQVLAKWFMEEENVDKQTLAPYLERFRKISNETAEMTSSI